MKIGKQIKKIREKKKLTMQELADRAGLAGKQSVYNIESGVRNPSTPMLKKIAKALDCRVEVILTEIEVK